MLQRVWKQLKSAGLDSSAVVATSRPQIEMIQNQIGTEAPLVVEPERRDTFPAISLATTYLYSILHVNLNETVVVLPVDLYVEDQFFTKIKELEFILHNSQANLALIGIHPTYPAEKYGYIIPASSVGDQNAVYRYVHSFKEKPNESEAKELLQKNALWNAGIFAFKMNYLISHLTRSGFPIHYDEMLKQYTKLPKISFDYEIVEKEKRIVVLPFDGKWKDIGTWDALGEVMSSSILGKGIMDDDCYNGHIINELDIPVAVLGLSNFIVAASPDGILVSAKGASSKLKEHIHFDQRPMYVERRWGWYKVLDHFKLRDGKEVLTKRICVKAGKNLSYQIHYKRCEVWSIIEGEGEFAYNGNIMKVKPGDVIQIREGAKHGIKAIEDLEFIEVQIGTELVEEDIVRIYITWDEVEKNCTKCDKTFIEWAKSMTEK